jgi:hypothetical protein
LEDLNLDFVAADLDFVVSGLDFLAENLDIVVGGFGFPSSRTRIAVPAS